MCGIFGFSSQKKPQAASEILAGLHRLEYRGYDSWGVAVLAAVQKIQVQKQVGKISGIKTLDLPESLVGIGHTRWATHGGVTQNNAHPHLSSDGRFALAQNGIVENMVELQTQLAAAGHAFQTETDTEVIVRLIEEQVKTIPDLFEAVRLAFLKLEGRNTIIVLAQDGEIIAARHGSPLLIGYVSDLQTTYISSDTLSLAPVVRDITVVENRQMVRLSPMGEVRLFAVESGESVALVKQPLGLEQQRLDKDGYPYFMEKEITESPQVLLTVAAQPVAELSELVQVVKQARHVYTIGSGTAGIAAAQIAYYLRQYGQLAATSLVGADAQEYLHLMTEADVLIAPSQSGETADVLAVLEEAKAKGVKIATYVNMVGSSMSRLADFSFQTQIGPEVCVMSTKVFTAQVAWGYLLAQTVAGKFDHAVQELQQTSQQVAAILSSPVLATQIQQIVEKILPQQHIFLLGKGRHLQIVREGMVKLIEGTYKHAHAIPAGDLKHYAITLIEQGTLVLFAYGSDETLTDLISAAQQVKARGAYCLGVGDVEQPIFDQSMVTGVTTELADLANVIPLQLLAYRLAVALGNDVDHPRNIAKSVTVR